MYEIRPVNTPAAESCSTAESGGYIPRRVGQVSASQPLSVRNFTSADDGSVGTV